MPHPQSPPWASLSQEEHEFQYNPQRAFPNFADHQLARVLRPTRLRRQA
jgi:arylformamidase